MQPRRIRFQSTLPVWGATIPQRAQPPRGRNINPRSPCGERLPSSKSYHAIGNFNPRSPCGERLYLSREGTPEFNDFNPRSPCGERRGYSASGEAILYFNPRSPCGERRHLYTSLVQYLYFNPRSPCGERPTFRITSSAPANGFQSTLPVWGATGFPSTSLSVITDFNPRSPCGERLLRLRFQLSASVISIHAPRVGSDSCAVEKPKPHCDFNPRSPCGERLFLSNCLMPDASFQSTLPVWGATLDAGVLPRQI